MTPKLQPKLRFRGFTDAWEQHKLGEIFSFKYGDGNCNPSNGGEYPVYGAGGIQGGFTNYNAEDSVIIGHMGDAGCVSWGEGRHFVTYNGTITKPKKNTFSSKFGYYLLLHMNLRKYRGGSGLPFLTYEMLSDMKTLCSENKEETDYIARFFSYQDKIISLYEHKRELLEQKKKAYLQKIFSQTLRFRGFTEPWEQRKVKDLFTITRGYILATTSISNTCTSEFPYPVYSSQTKDDGKLGYYSDYLFQDAITWTTDGANAGEVNFRRGKFFCTNVCGVLLSNQYTANLMLAEALNRITKRYVSYVGNPKLMNNVMAEIEVVAPKNAEEQIAISNLFQKINDLVKLYDQKITLLKQKKQAYLQQMFV